MCFLHVCVIGNSLRQTLFLSEYIDEAILNYSNNLVTQTSFPQLDLSADMPTTHDCASSALLRADLGPQASCWAQRGGLAAVPEGDQHQ